MEEVQKIYGGDLHQLHLSARIHYYRCSLPGLAGFAVYRREGTNADHHRHAKFDQLEQKLAVSCRAKDYEGRYFF